ncbi:hypothetical protein D3C85_950380 [compost metagenome]
MLNFPCLAHPGRPDPGIFGQLGQPLAPLIDQYGKTSGNRTIAQGQRRQQPIELDRFFARLVELFAGLYCRLYNPCFHRLPEAEQLGTPLDHLHGAPDLHHQSDPVSHLDKGFGNPTNGDGA